MDALDGVHGARCGRVPPTTTPTPSEREVFGVLRFDGALEAYACGNIDAEVLAHTARLVIDSTIPFDPDDAKGIVELTGAIVKLRTYGDVGRAVQRWFAAMDEAGVRY